MFIFIRKPGVIGPSVIEAAQNYFHSGFLPNQVNCTYVTLVPKTQSANTIRDYRPIACCYVLYKIISKVLANRLQSVLGDIIGDCQSAFVKGTVIFDNILLSQSAFVTGRVICEANQRLW